MPTWDEILTWNLVLPPSRPSTHHLRQIAEALEPLDRGVPVGILGSTPEFRDLLVELGFQRIFVFDNNRGTYERMTRLRVNQGAEQLECGHWLDTLQRFHQEFAVLLSDLTSGNLRYDERAPFYALISRSLMTGGLFIDKVLTHPVRHLELDLLAADYETRALNLAEVNRFSCEFFFCSQLLDLAEVVDTTLFYEVLERRFPHPRMRAFLREVPAVTPRGCIWYYGRAWEQLEPEYCRGLRRVAIFEDDPGSPYYGRLKLFISRKS